MLSVVLCAFEEAFLSAWSHGALSVLLVLLLVVSLLLLLKQRCWCHHGVHRSSCCDLAWVALPTRRLSWPYTKRLGSSVVCYSCLSIPQKHPSVEFQWLTLIANLHLLAADFCLINRTSACMSGLSSYIYEMLVHPDSWMTLLCG